VNVFAKGRPKPPRCNERLVRRRNLRPVYADDRNFYKVEKWTCGTKVDTQSPNSRATISWRYTNRSGERLMPTDKLLYFCPSCNALYQMVKAAAGPETISGGSSLLEFCQPVCCHCRGGSTRYAANSSSDAFASFRSRGEPRFHGGYDLIAAYQLTRARRCCSGTRTRCSRTSLLRPS
jgi:hypothetical protein